MTTLNISCKISDAVGTQNGSHRGHNVSLGSKKRPKRLSSTFICLSAIEREPRAELEADKSHVGWISRTKLANKYRADTVSTIGGNHSQNDPENMRRTGSVRKNDTSHNMKAHVMLRGAESLHLSLAALTS